MTTSNVTSFPGTGDVWQVRKILVPGWVEGGDAPYRPVGALAVSRRHDLLGAADDAAESGPGHRQAEQALASLARLTGDRPAVIEVVDPDLAARLGASRRWRECEIRVRDTLEDVDRAYAALREHFEEDQRQPSIRDGEGVTVAGVRRFAEAAAELWESAPWRMFTDTDVLGLSLSPGHPELGACTVIGIAGEEFGILLAEDPQVFEDMQAEAEDPLDLRAPMWSMSFDHPWELPVADHDLWLEHDLPRVDEGRIPSVQRYERGATEIRRATASELQAVVEVITALARTTEEQSVLESWSVEVLRPGGSAEVRFSWPPLEPDDVAAMLADFDAAVAPDEDDPEEIDGEAALADAHTLATLSFNLSGRLAARLAARAIAVNPGEAKGYHAAAAAAADPNRATIFARQGIRILRENIGESTIAAARGEITSIEGGRTLLGLCHLLATALAAAGRPDEALEVDDEMLALDTFDRFGARFLRAAHLIEAERPGEALTWLQECCADEASADARYLTALARHLTDGPGAAADRDLEAAIACNESAPLLILGVLPLPGVERATYEPGSPDEAAFHAQRFAWLWQRHPESLSWLSERFARHLAAANRASHSRRSKPKRRRR